ncbi:putative ribonuclease [Cercophora samala]|uniref:ribonuclease H n=1 Tax=Cercophora samala TaxID=330535 RepID=A0AA39ZE25_9PEZI|nr:putative ribonuclease [Cercophora samala]
MHTHTDLVIDKSFPTLKEAEDWFNDGRPSSNNTTNQQASASSTRQRFQQPPSDLSPPQRYPVGNNNRYDAPPSPPPAPLPLSPPPPPAEPTGYPILNTVSDSFVLPQKTQRPDSTSTTSSSATNTTTAPPAKRPRPNPDPGELTVVYTDGAAPGNGKSHATAGIGVYFGPGDPRNISRRLPGPLQTNQRAELMAIQLALEWFPPTTSVEIRTDSQYSIDCVTKWYLGWVKNGWKSAKEGPVKNDDIIKPIRALIDKRDAAGARTKFTKVAGHSGDKGNDEADRLAVEGAKLPEVRD